MAARAVFLAHRYPAVGDDAVGAVDRLFGDRGQSVTAPPLARAQSTYLCIGSLPSGTAMFSLKPKRAEASSSECSTLLPSPVQAKVLPRDRAAMLLEGHDVGHDLAGMGVVGQAVDDRNGGVLGQFDQPVVRSVVRIMIAST